MKYKREVHTNESHIQSNGSRGGPEHPGCAARATGHANRIQSWRIAVRRAARAVGERSASSGHRDPWRLLARGLRVDGSRESVRSGNPAGTGDVEPGIPTHWKSRWRMAGDARRCANGRGAFGKDRGGAITRSETRGGDGALRGRTPRALAGETERDCAEGLSGARSGGGFAPCVGTQAEQHGGGGFVGRIAAGFAGPLSVRVADRTGAT